MEHFIRTAVAAALHAGQEILAIYNSRHHHLKVGMKANLLPQTNADLNSHRAILETLAETGLPVLSEEGEHIDYEVRRNWERFWLIDPLAGTKEFLRRSGEFCVNIALIDRCRPVLGVIYAPVSGELYWGAETIRARKCICHEIPQDFEELCKQSITLPLLQNSKKMRVAGSRFLKSTDNDQLVGYLERKGNGRKIEFVNLGGSLKICRVAEGQADLLPRLEPSMEWDTAAGHAIATAAGKQVTQMDYKTPLIYNKQELVNPYFIVY